MTTKIKPYQSEMKENFVFYQMDSSRNIAVYVAENTVWLTQAQIAELFLTTPQNVTTHIRNIFKENELEKSATCKEFLQVQQEGNRQVSRHKLFYNLDMVRHNKQYPEVLVHEIPAVHDRFLLLDGSQLYTFGASFKDLGKKLFCFTKIESTEVVEVVRKLVAN